MVQSGRIGRRRVWLGARSLIVRLNTSPSKQQVSDHDIQCWEELESCFKSSTSLMGIPHDRISFLCGDSAEN